MSTKVNESQDQQAVNKKGQSKKKMNEEKSSSSSRESSETIRAPKSPRDQWELWSHWLKNRPAPQCIKEAMSGGKQSPLLWGLSDDLQPSTETAAFFDECYRLVRKPKSLSATLLRTLEGWDESFSKRELTADTALELLAVAHCLPQLSRHLPAAPWWDLLALLIEVSQDGKSVSMTSDPITHQLCQTELPLTLAFLFPELSDCTRLTKKAGKKLGQAIERLLDGEGLPQAKHIGLARPLLATWTRSLALADNTKAEWVDRDERLQYEWLVRQVFRLTRNDGSQMFSVESDSVLSPAFTKKVIEVCNDADDTQIAKIVSLDSKKKNKKRDLSSLPPSASYSPWSETAILRSSWCPQREKLGVAFANQPLNVDLSAISTISSGPWCTRICLDGKEISMESSWEEICWHSDDDVDYLELEAEFDSGIVVQRQFLMAKNDRFLLTADVILGTEVEAIDYQCEIPLHPGISISATNDSRELVLNAPRPQATVLPLALSEWSSEKQSGELEVQRDRLVLTQQAKAQRMYAPLFWDLEPKRAFKPLTWRQLTVGEQLEIVDAQDAVGFRVQIGKRQWMIYRSLAEKANRTVFGQNLSCEFFCARFDHFGDADELLSLD